MFYFLVLGFDKLPLWGILLISAGSAVVCALVVWFFVCPRMKKKIDRKYPALCAERGPPPSSPLQRPISWAALSRDLQLHLSLEPLRVPTAGLMAPRASGRPRSTRGSPDCCWEQRRAAGPWPCLHCRLLTFNPSVAGDRCGLRDRAVRAGEILHPGQKYPWKYPQRQSRGSRSTGGPCALTYSRSMQPASLFADL